jgi:hypothetical protein
VHKFLPACSYSFLLFISFEIGYNLKDFNRNRSLKCVSYTMLMYYIIYVIYFEIGYNLKDFNRNRSLKCVSYTMLMYLYDIPQPCHGSGG